MFTSNEEVILFICKYFKLKLVQSNDQTPRDIFKMSVHIRLLFYMLMFMHIETIFRSKKFRKLFCIRCPTEKKFDIWCVKFLMSTMYIEYVLNNNLPRKLGGNSVIPTVRDIPQKILTNRNKNKYIFAVMSAVKTCSKDSFSVHLAIHSRLRLYINFNIILQC